MFIVHKPVIEMFNNNPSIKSRYHYIDICQLLQFWSTLYGQLSTF